MTGRERLAAVQVGEVDQKPVIAWGLKYPKADAVVVEAFSPSADMAVLVRVDSPLTKQIQRGLQLNALLHSDPEEGNRVLDGLVEETLVEGKQALADGADGIAYVINGAYPGETTPMQFGGYYLERDREILEELQSANFNLVFIEGGKEVYLDSVSDLAANAIGWRFTETGFTKEMMRELRCGPLAGDHETADIQICFSQESLDAFLRSNSTTGVSA